MTKEELKEAIAATITENGQKGITGQALANLLNEIVDAAGSGSGNAGTGGFTLEYTEGPSEKNAAIFETIVSGASNNEGYNIFLISEGLCVPACLYTVDETGVVFYFDLSALSADAGKIIVIMKPDGSLKSMG